MNRERKAFLPRSRPSAAWPLALLAGLALAPCGCLFDQFGGSRSDVSLGRGHLVVLPFGTPNKPPFESQLGARFSRDVARIVRDKCSSARVTDVDGVLDAIREPDLQKMAVLDIARKLGADLAMIGEIHEIRGKDPASLNVLKGTMVVSSRVINVRSGKVVWEGARETYHYPKRLLGGEEIPAQLTETEEEVVKEVMAEAARGTAEVFTGRTPRTSQKVEKAFE